MAVSRRWYKSLTLPPETLKNAELKKPVTKRKVRYTPKHVVISGSLQYSECLQLTDIGCERNWPTKHEEQEIRYAVHRIASINLGQRSNKKRAKC